jgi:sigma-B regulation protein RsbU (phosphoserine phosphatase)
MALSNSQTAKFRPWLLTLVVIFAAATVTYSVAWMYYIRAKFQVEIGIETEPLASGIAVAKVWKGGPAEKVGVQKNDLIVALDGEPYVAAEQGGNLLHKIWLTARPGDQVTLTIKRAGHPAPLILSPTFRAIQGTGDAVSLVRRGAGQIVGMYPLLFLVVGLTVLFFRPEDRNAWLLALMFGGFISMSDLPFSLITAPVALRHFLFAYNSLLKSLLPGLFYFFFAVFPTRSPIDRRVPWLKWVLLLIGIGLGWGGILQGDSVALPFVIALFGQHATGLIRLVTAYGTVVLGLISLFLNFFGASNIEDRRKLKVMLWGTLVGITPAIVIGVPYDLSHQDIPFWLDFIRVFVLFLLPLSFAYSVVKHRVMDIPVLLRRSARYFIVERGFAILIFVISVAATLGLAQTFSSHFSSGSKAAIPVGATFGILLISGATQVHRRVRTRLDRAFFRSSYDAQQILENLAAKTLMVNSREDLAELLHDEIRDALHPQSIFVYLRSEDGSLYAFAGHPPQEAMTLSTSVPGIDGLLDSTGPVEVNPQLSHGAQLDALGVECWVPIRGSSDGHLQGAAVLGPRLSEEPYSTGDKRLLASVASQAGVAMRSISMAEKMAERMEVERRSEQEMQIARQVQSRLLPQHAPMLPTLECAGKCIQTRAVGGDYYDFLDFGSGRLGLVLADIAGKGISAALLMANLQANLRGQYALALEDLSGLLRSVNRLFYKNTESNHYATMFFAVYDDDNRVLRYVNCGHNPPILLRANGDIERLEATATVLGLFDEWECQVAERQLSAGDLLVIYTDGVSEAAPGEDAEEFGDDRLIANLKIHQGKPADTILDEVIAEVQRFSQGEQADDMTLIVSRCC